MSVDRYQRAITAYMEIIMADRTEGESGFCPPPKGTEWRDKKWGKELRSMWPGFRSVKVDDTRGHSDKFKWCEQQSGFFWVAGNSKVWYFSDPETAVLFKLVFGGSVEE